MSDIIKCPICKRDTPTTYEPVGLCFSCESERQDYVRISPTKALVDELRKRDGVEVLAEIEPHKTMSFLHEHGPAIILRITD